MVPAWITLYVSADITSGRAIYNAQCHHLHELSSSVCITSSACRTHSKVPSIADETLSALDSDGRYLATVGSGIERLYYCVGAVVVGPVQ